MTKLLLNTGKVNCSKQDKYLNTPSHYAIVVLNNSEGKLNDDINAPMYLLDNANALRLYDVPYLDQTPNTYVWNYNPDWSALRAGWMRLYATPNVGSILIAGNLTADVISSGTTVNYPSTVRWSQSFGQNAGRWHAIINTWGSCR